MGMMANRFEPWDALVGGTAHKACRAVVIVPARNEERTLGATLDSLALQIGLDGAPLPRECFEVILLLNNCSDGSARVACDWTKLHPAVQLHVVERELAPEEAFVGTARRMLMDTAWRRLQRRSEICGILSTDSDTIVREDWVAQNLAALERGADAVGGVIALKDKDLELLPKGVLHAYQRDRRYQSLVAELEDRLDPQDGDRWPRHLEHFGASLACTPDIYARAGGMAAVSLLEDVDFVDRLRRAGARLRHHPDVVVFTSSRMSGRVEVGLSGQLRLWNQMSERNEEHRVQSAEWLAHRFQWLRRLRVEANVRGMVAAKYLAEVDCDRLIAESFIGVREGEITDVSRRISRMLVPRRVKSTQREQPVLESQQQGLA